MAALSVAQFLERLGAGKPVLAVLLLGDDLYLLDRCRKALVERLVPEGARDWGVSRYSLRDASLDDILGRARTLPMLSPRQVVFAGECEAAEKLGEKSREEFVATLGEYLEDPAPFTTLVLEATKLDMRMRLGKLLAGKAQVVAVALPEATDARSAAERAAVAGAMAAQMARELGVELEPAAAAELAEAAAGSLARIRTELEKLATYVGERRRITVADVDRLVVAAHTEDVWQLGEAVAMRDAARALALLDGIFARGEQPAMLVGGLAWLYRKLLEVQELPQSAGAGQVAGRLRMRRDTAEMALRQARRIPREQLLAGLVDLYEADNRLKSGARDLRAVMEFLVTRLAAPPAGVEANLPQRTAADGGKDL
jgi:DNA polymerase III subunit delta